MECTCRVYTELLLQKGNLDQVFKRSLSLIIKRRRMIKRNIINEAINELVKTSQKSRFHNNGSFHYKVDSNATGRGFSSCQIQTLVGFF